MKTLILVIALSGIFVGSGIAQDNIYYTRNATLQVNGKIGSEELFGQTKELGVSLDYETTEMILRFYLNKLEFNIDTINTILKTEFLEVIFKGELNLEYINTKDHSPLDFSVEGWLSAGNSKIKLTGEGELHHINDSGDYVCMLGITININLNDLNMDIPPGMYEEVEVVITQALLEKDKN